jgi:hypothetical protein
LWAWCGNSWDTLLGGLLTFVPSVAPQLVKGAGAGANAQSVLIFYSELVDSLLVEETVLGAILNIVLNIAQELGPYRNMSFLRKKIQA